MIQIIKQDLDCKITPKYKNAKQFEEAFRKDDFVPCGDIVYLEFDHTVENRTAFDNKCCSCYTDENDTLYITTVDGELNLLDKEFYCGHFVDKTDNHPDIEVVETVIPYSTFLKLQSLYYKVLSVKYQIDIDKQSVSYIWDTDNNEAVFGRWDEDTYGLLPLDGQCLSDLDKMSYRQIHYLTACTQQLFELQFPQPLIIKHAPPQLAVRVRYIPHTR